MEKLRIFVCAHKSDPSTRNTLPFVPIQGGKELHKDIDLGYICDNTGDNISNKNNKYSEWSVIYWIWKNVKDVEYIGLNHYRRYFGIDINESNIDKLMKGKDAIVIKQSNFSKKQRIDDLIKMTSLEDAYIYLDTLLSMRCEYEKQIVDYYYNSRDSVPYSMFVMRKSLFDEFCNFIFPVLFESEKRIRDHGYSRQQRTMGYFGEYSLGLFLHCRNLKSYKVPLLTTINKEKSILNKVKILVHSTCYRIMDRFSRTPKHFIVPECLYPGLKQDSIPLRYFKD